MGRETYTQREDFFFPSSSRSQGVPTLAPPCKLRHLCLAVCPLLDCYSLHSLNLIAGFSSCDLLPVTHLLYPSALIVVSSSCLLIKMWEIAKALGVTRNELKIHVICYITLQCRSSLCLHLGSRLLLLYFSFMKLVIESIINNVCVSKKITDNFFSKKYALQLFSF